MTAQGRPPAAKMRARVATVVQGTKRQPCQARARRSSGRRSLRRAPRPSSFLAPTLAACASLTAVSSPTRRTCPSTSARPTRRARSLFRWDDLRGIYWPGRPIRGRGRGSHWTIPTYLVLKKIQKYSTKFSGIPHISTFFHVHFLHIETPYSNESLLAKIGFDIAENEPSTFA